MNSPPPSDPWNLGAAYERYCGRWSRQVAGPFLSWLAVPAGRRWVDVGCGTGALCSRIVADASPSSVTGVEPSVGFLETARTNLRDKAVLLRGSATAIPLADAAADAVVSALLLNFVADPRAALAEMARVTAPGGFVAAYVWDYASGMEMMRVFWDAAVQLNPGAAAMDEAVRFPLCRPAALADLFAGAGLKQVDVIPIDVATSFADFDDYWQPFLGGQGPAPAYAVSLDESSRARLRDRVRDRLPFGQDGSISLAARAWGVRGTVARGDVSPEPAGP
jgi:SAM-dependent methyltransferase